MRRYEVVATAAEIASPGVYVTDDSGRANLRARLSLGGLGDSPNPPIPER